MYQKQENAAKNTKTQDFQEIGEDIFVKDTFLAVFVQKSGRTVTFCMKSVILWGFTKIPDSIGFPTKDPMRLSGRKTDVKRVLLRM